MKRYGLLSIACILFILPKLLTTGIRLSDSNIYFYTAYTLLHGKLLYKDIFFTNFPFLPYISIIYYLLSFGKLQMYYLTSSLEAILTAIVLYHIVIREQKEQFYAIVTVFLYLFSFIVLSTSDHQTGVFTASFFAVLAYFFRLRKQLLWAGVTLGIMLMTKAYFLPIFLALSIDTFIHERKQLFHYIAGISISVFIILLPSLLFARKDLIHDVFVYSLTRSQGVSKMNIVWFFIKHDFLLACLLTYSLMSIRKQLFLGILSLSGILFFILYKDIYYLYLNFLIPFLCLSFPSVLTQTKNALPSHKAITITILFLLLSSNYLIYIRGYSTLGRIPDITPLVDTITTNRPSVLYGVNDITPALAYLTHTHMLNNIIDTNENIYRKGFLNGNRLTDDAIHDHAMIVTHGVSYPDMGINQEIVGGIFNEQLIKSHCVKKATDPVHTEGIENAVNLFSCR